MKSAEHYVVYLRRRMGLCECAKCGKQYAADVQRVMDDASKEAEQRGYARGVTEAAAVVDRIGRDWFDFGDAAKSYGAQYLVEKIRALVPHE